MNLSLVAIAVSFILLIGTVIISYLIIQKFKSRLKLSIEAANKIALGNLSFTLDVTGKDEIALLNSAIIKTKDNIKSLINDAHTLTTEAAEGHLGARADVSQYAGEYKTIIVGINELVESIASPMQVVAHYIDEISKGNMPENISTEFKGDFDNIRVNLNTCIHSINTMLKDAAMLSSAVMQGNLEVRADASSIPGEYGRIVSGLNDLFDLILSPINDVVRVFGALASNNFTETIFLPYVGIFGKMTDDANATVSKLTVVIQQIKEAADNVSSAAKEIASGNADLSNRTEKQAASIENTAASMEKITTTAKHNADNAKHARQLAESASDVALKGGTVMAEVVSTMTVINNSSQKISDIISVIDGIAFQTNILALNAAVEAARAGEQGRGFAVVATEVRNLAHRSASAAKEIKHLIEDSSHNVTIGTKLAGQAGQTMQDIVSSVNRVTDIMGEITAASIEQSQGVEEINAAITQMDDVTQQNAALVEEAAAAAESLEDQAGQLASMMSAFRLSW